MRITVYINKFTENAFYIHDDEIVLSLKYQIQEIFKYDMDKQEICYKGTLLDNYETFDKYNILPGDILFLIMKVE